MEAQRNRFRVRGLGSDALHVGNRNPIDPFKGTL